VAELHIIVVDIQDKPPLVHVGHYGSPTVTVDEDTLDSELGDKEVSRLWNGYLPGIRQGTPGTVNPNPNTKP
jgi:hypothetical protein